MSKNNWQHRKADTLAERLGLLDEPKRIKFKRFPVFTEPKSDPVGGPLTAIGLTSGIGSMLVGAKQLGFQIIGNVEWRDYYRYNIKHSTMVENFPGAFMARGLDDVPPDLLPSQIDFAAGHPECGLYSNLRFSVQNRDMEEMGNDTGDIPLFLEYIAKLRPRFFLMDDLPLSFKALPLQAYMDLLPDYDLFPEWISNWGYGNIQKYRNRMFMVGALKSERFVFVPGEKAHPIVTRDVIGDLQLNAGQGDIPNHATVDMTRIPGRFVNLRYLGDRATWEEVCDFMRENHCDGSKPYYNRKGEYKTRPGTVDPKWGGFCPVLSGGYSPFHPVEWRPLSIRERARIQGFPDDFIFHYDPKTPDHPIWEPYSGDGNRGVKQTGKSMPIQFTTFVAAQVKAHIEGEPFEASGERVIKPNPHVSEAKYYFCKHSGFADQDGACKHCWMRETCDLPGMNSTPQLPGL